MQILKNKEGIYDLIYLRRGKSISFWTGSTVSKCVHGESVRLSGMTYDKKYTEKLIKKAN